MTNSAENNNNNTTTNSIIRMNNSNRKSNQVKIEVNQDDDDDIEENSPASPKKAQNQSDRQDMHISSGGQNIITQEDLTPNQKSDSKKSRQTRVVDTFLKANQEGSQEQLLEIKQKNFELFGKAMDSVKLTNSSMHDDHMTNLGGDLDQLHNPKVMTTTLST